MAADARSEAGVSTVFSAKLSEIGAQTALDGAQSVAAVPSSEAQLRVIRRGRFRGLPNETDANGEVQLVMVGEEFWLRFFRLKVYNNPVRDTLYLYFFRHKKVPRTVVLGAETVLVRLSGTPHGGLEDSMPDEIQMPLDNVRTKKGHAIDQSAFESMVIVRPGIKMSDGSVIPTVVHAFCEFEEVQLSNLAFNKTVQGAVNNVTETRNMLETGNHTYSLKGKSYNDTEKIAKGSLKMMGKNSKDEIKFEEFKVILASLEITHTEARAYKWFVLGDVNRNGSMDLGELTFVLFVIANSKPSRLLRPRDVFLMFDIDSKPANEKDRTGTIDLIGFYECVRAFNASVAQESIEAVFKHEDKKHLHRLNYRQFLAAFVQLISAKAELEKRGISAKSVLGVDVQQVGSQEADEQAGQALQQFLLQTLLAEDQEEDDDLHAAVERAHHARGKVRAGREKGKRDRIKQKAETDKAVRRQKALEERARRLAAVKAQEEAADRARKETELHRKALAEKQEREKQELEQIRRAALEAEEAEKRKRRELALDRIHMQNKGLAYVPSTLWLDPASSKHLPFVITFDVSENALVRLPEKHLFQTMEQLRKFDCSKNQLTSIPDAISTCHELLILKADDNQLKLLPDMSGLDQLQLLSLRGNDISEIGVETVALQNLKRFNISLNPLEHIGEDSFQAMSLLTELHLQSCNLEFLPASVFRNLTSLRKLFLSGNKLRELPESVGSLVALEELDASHNALRLLPDGIGALARLLQLDLGYNQLRELPEDLTGLSFLLGLNLEYNVLTSLPESLGALVFLQKLAVCHNQLSVLPDVLGRLEDLQVLDVSHNKLTFFPDTIGGLIRVKHVNAAHNQLGKGGVSCFPQSFASLQAVEWLDISFNNIRRIAPQISGLAGMIFANFSHNELQELPPQLCILPRVKVLDVSFNQLNTLPIEFGMLSALEAVDLSCNTLRSVPDCLGDLKLLRHLHMYNNRLNKLPLTLSSLLRGLVSFDCARNPLRSLPAKFVAADVLGAGGLNLRFSRSTVAGKNVLNEIRDGLQRDVERGHLIEVDTVFDAREADRASMQLEDTRAALWRKAGTHTKLLNYCMPSLWRPVDLAEDNGELRSAAEHFPSNIDDWWKERGDAEKRRREQLQQERNRNRNVIKKQLLEEAAAMPKSGEVSELERTRMRFSMSPHGSERASRTRTAQQQLKEYEAQWRREDEELEWSRLDMEWSSKLHQRVTVKEDARKTEIALQADQRQAESRAAFWQSKGIEVPIEGHVPSLREMHAGTVRQMGKPPRADHAKLSIEEGDTSKSMSSTPSSTQKVLVNKTQAPAHVEVGTEFREAPGSALSKMHQTLEAQMPVSTPESSQPTVGSLLSDEQQAGGQVEDVSGLDLENQSDTQEANEGGLEVEAAMLAQKIRKHEAEAAATRSATQQGGKLTLSDAAKAELELINTELKHGPPAPVVGAFRRTSKNGGKGGLTDRLMTPYDKGSRLRALALGKGRPGSIELAVRPTLISGQALSEVVKTAHTKSRFNYQTSSMFEHHRDIQSLAERKLQLQKKTGTALDPAPFRGRYNLTSYQVFDQSGLQPPTSVDDLRQRNRGKVVGLSRFNCEDYPLYKASTVTQQAAAAGQKTGFESSSIPTTVQEEAKSSQNEATETAQVVGADRSSNSREQRRGTKIADLPRRAKTHRYNMSKSMININPNRTLGGTAFNPELARKRLADIQRKLLAEATISENNIDSMLDAIFEPGERAGDDADSEVSRLQGFVRDLEEDPNVPMGASELQEVRQLLMECAAAGSSSDGLVPDIQPRAWQPAGYRLSSRDAQKKLDKAKQLIMALKVGGNTNLAENVPSERGDSAPKHLRPVRDDAWEVERAELSAPSAESAIVLAGSVSFGDKLSTNLWGSSPYEPSQGVGFDAAQNSVLAKTSSQATTAESKAELSLLAQSRLHNESLTLPSEVPRALTAKLASSKQDRKRSRRWQTSGQLGDHNTKPKIGDTANLAQTANGYTPSDAADYLSVQAVVSEPCMAEWVSNGGLYMEGGLRMSDFISSVRRRLKQEWDASFTEAVKRFYIDTRASGGEPTVLTFEPESIEAAKRQRGQHYQRLRDQHHERVVEKMDAMYAAKLDKYAVTPELLRRRMVSQEGRAAAMKDFKEQSWLRQMRTESRAATTRQTQRMVGNYKDEKEARQAETARLVEDTARRAQKLDRKARDRETYKALLAQGIVPSAQNPLFNHSSLTLPGGSADSLPGFFDQHSPTDDASDGGLYEGDSQELQESAADTPQAAAQLDSLEDFAGRFLTSEEAALLAVASPPARNMSVQQASIEALGSVESFPPIERAQRQNLAARAAGDILVRQGSVDWAAGVAANHVSQLYESARKVFVDGKSSPAHKA